MVNAEPMTTEQSYVDAVDALTRAMFRHAYHDVAVREWGMDEDQHERHDAQSGFDRLRAALALLAGEDEATAVASEAYRRANLRVSGA